MIAAWMLYAFITTAVLAVAAAAVEKICRMHRRSGRWVWLIAMVAPFVLALAPTYSVSPATQEGAVASSQTTASTLSSPLEAASVIPKVIERVSTAPDAGRLDDVLGLAWLGLSLLVAALFVVSALRLRRAARTWVPGCVGGAQVLVADRVGPAVFGVVRPMIVAPCWLMQSPIEVQSAVIAHEQEHLRAHDSRIAAAALLLVVAAPWNAPLWWMLRRLRAAIEIDCDARVLRSGCSASQYGAALIDIAERRSFLPMLSPAMHGAACDLELRLTMLFPSPRGASRFAAVLFGLLAGALAVGATQIDPPAREAQAPSEAREERRISRRSAAMGRELLDEAMRGDLEKASQLLAGGADANRVVRGDGTPLIVAARRGDAAMVDLLLRHGAEPNRSVAGDGNPLIMAASRGHEAIVATLLRHGADVNAVVVGDETPLINAARGGHLPIVRTLVEHGADISLAVRADASPWAELRSPESEARKYGRREVLDYLRARQAGR